jgi:hypothetical protein
VLGVEPSTFRSELERRARLGADGVLEAVLGIGAPSGFRLVMPFETAAVRMVVSVHHREDP